jgi:hypothetical protein
METELLVAKFDNMTGADAMLETLKDLQHNNFIELLDDVVPGMWAEMLNDRSFEGVTRPANWCYYDGSLTICDRDWDRDQLLGARQPHPVAA